MSRFFATGSDSESESSSEEEQIVRQPVATFTFSEDEEETKRVVRSTKEKRYEELTGIIKNLRNYKKIKDMPAMLTSFEELQKAYTKAAPVVLKEEGGIAPRFFIRCLVECDEFILQVWEDRDGRKNMSKGNSKALASLRQKLRKYTKEFDPEMAKFREQPDLPDDDEEPKDSESSDSEEERVKEDIRRVHVEVGDKEARGEGRDAGAEPGDDRGSDSDSDSVDWGSSTSSSGSSDDDDDKYASIRERFLKRATDREDREDDGERERRRERKVRRGERGARRAQRDEAEAESAAGGGWETVRKGAAAGPERTDMFAPDADVDTPLILNKLGEVSAARGRKRTDRRAQLSLLGELRTVAEKHRLGPALQLKLRAAIVSAIFDYNLKVSDAMKPDHWSKLMENVGEMITILLAHEDMIISESFTEDGEDLVNPPYRVRGCVLTALERLDDEFAKLLKECDPHSNEYVERLKDEPKVVELINRVLEYEEKRGTPSERCRIYLRKVEHLYYKFDQRSLDQKAGKVPHEEETSVHVMEKLCKFIYSNDATDRLRTRAILAHIYHHALHDNWFQARDLLLMSHLQETVHHSDPSTQILYNRTMANLGLCAFRRGDIKDAHGCLVDLMMTGKPKELLAQGLLPQRQHERSKEQEKIEKQRQMPFHMHVNLELLECAYLVSAMLIEIPYMAAHEFDARRRMISKTFYQNLRASERLALVGPPESMREHVVAAARAMRRGDWRACYKAVVNEKMNAKVWDLMADGDAVRLMLQRLVREECLRTYLFTYSNVYASLSLPALAEMFELPLARAHSLVSKMIINEELLASMDDPSECVVLHRSEPSRLQALALQLTDKVANFVDSNERIFETKQGAFFQRGGQQGFRGGGGGGQGRDGGQGGGGQGRDGGNRGGDQRRGGDWQRRGPRRHNRRDDDRHHEQEAY